MHKHRGITQKVVKEIGSWVYCLDMQIDIRGIH